MVTEFEGQQLEELYDRVLVSVGRSAAGEDLGLENTKVVRDDKGFIEVNSHQQTADPSIYAIGDIAGGVMLAHKAHKEARIAVENICGQTSSFDNIVIPAVFFTDPELAWSGLTESEAKARGIKVEVAKFPWAASGRALSFDRTDGMTKLIIDPESERILGAGIVGHNAGELIAEATVLIEMALSLGTPPIPGQSIVRRPRNAHLTTLSELLAPHGVSPYFFYGGYGYFDNMNAYFGANRYEVVDRTDIPNSAIAAENVWGVADESLYDQVLRTLDAHPGGRPFFAHVMTTSNHRPFTYPQGRIDIPSPGGREGAVKYTDYAIGRFIAQARSKPWFADTLFVITADHCDSVAGKTQLPVARRQGACRSARVCGVRSGAPRSLRGRTQAGLQGVGVPI